MAGDIESQDSFFAGKFFRFGPFRDSANIGRLVIFAPLRSNKFDCPFQSVPADFDRTDGGLDITKDLRTIIVERVECPD